MTDSNGFPIAKDSWVLAFKNLEHDYDVEITDTNGFVVKLNETKKEKLEENITDINGFLW